MLVVAFVSLKAASNAGVASAGTRIAIACGLVVLGAVLAFDVKGISSTLVRNSSGFTPWGKKRQQWGLPNPGRLVGVFLFIGGVITLISVAFNP